MKRKQVRFQFFLLVIAILLAAAIGAGVYLHARAAPQGSRYLEEELQLTEDIKASGMVDIQNVTVRQEKNGAALQVVETIGDTRNLCALVRVQFPKEQVDLSALLETHDSNRMDFSILPRNIGLFDEGVLDKEADSLSSYQSHKISGCSSLMLVDLDLPENAAVYLFQYHTYRKALTGKTVTLALDSFYVQGMDQEHLWGENDLLRVDWTINHTAEPLNFSFSEGEAQGTVSLSPLALEIDFTSGNGLSLEQRAKEIRLLDASKNNIPFPSGRRTFGDASTFVQMFNPLLDLQQVRYIQIGDSMVSVP